MRKIVVKVPNRPVKVRIKVRTVVTRRVTRR